MHSKHTEGANFSENKERASPLANESRVHPAAILRNETNSDPQIETQVSDASETLSNNILENTKTFKAHGLPVTKASKNVLMSNPSNLKSNIETLEAHNISITRAMSLLTSRPSTLKSNIETLEKKELPIPKSINVLRTTPSNLESNIKILEAHNISLTLAMSALKSRPANLEANIETLEKKGLPLDQSIEVLRANHSNLESNINILEAHGMPFDKSISVLTSNPSNLEKNIIILEAHNLPITQSLTLLMSSTSDLIENIKILEKKGLPLNQSMEVLSANPSNLKKNIRTLEKKGLPLSQSMKILRADPSNLRDNIKTLEKKGLPFDQSMEVLLSNPADLKKNIRTIEANGRLMGQSITVLMSSPSKLEKNIKTLETYKLPPSVEINLRLQPEEFKNKILDLLKQNAVLSEDAKSNYSDRELNEILQKVEEGHTPNKKGGTIEQAESPIPPTVPAILTSDHAVAKEDTVVLKDGNVFPVKSSKDIKLQNSTFLEEKSKALKDHKTAHSRHIKAYSLAVQHKESKYEPPSVRKQSVAVYYFLNESSKKNFEYLIDRILNSDEKKIFSEIGELLGNGAKLSKEYIKQIVNKHTEYAIADYRLNKILKELRGILQSPIHVLRSDKAASEENINIMDASIAEPPASIQESIPSTLPEELIEKPQDVSKLIRRTPATYSRKRYTYFISDMACFERRIEELNAHEQKAFRRIGEELKEKKEISKKEIEKIFEEETRPDYPKKIYGPGFNSCLRTKLTRILNTYFNEALKKK